MCEIEHSNMKSEDAAYERFIRNAQFKSTLEKKLELRNIKYVEENIHILAHCTQNYDRTYTKFIVLEYLFQNSENIPVMANAFDFYTKKLFNSSTKEKKEGKDRVAYHYIPAGRRFFLDVIRRLYKKYHMDTFVDVGCGIGDKPLLATLLGFKNSVGLEITRHTFEVAKFIRNLLFESYREKCRFFLCDCITDLQKYNKWFEGKTLFYTYEPIPGGKPLHSLYLSILSAMKNGDIWFEILDRELCDFLSIYPEHQFYIRKEKNYFCARDFETHRFVKKFKLSYVLERIEKNTW